MSLKTIYNKKQGSKSPCICKEIIDFAPVSLSDKELYNSYMLSSDDIGCENSFANIFLWGDQKIAYICGHVVRLARFGNFEFYAYPIGNGDKKEVIDALITDAKRRGINFSMGGITKEGKELISAWYGDEIELVERRNSFDYVYEIEDLATLGGKKYHSKRNHFSNFIKAHPHYTVEEISRENIGALVRMTEEWYKDKEKSSPETDFSGERAAIFKAFDNYFDMGLDGIAIFDNGTPLAFTIGNFLTYNTFDINFEKAVSGVNGAYAAVNKEFANYLKIKYPRIEYLNREEDMGLPGLRKAKESYYPHHMVEKYRAYLRETDDED